MGPGEEATDCVLVGGLRIGFRRAGEGLPVVLLHGGLGDSRVWRDQIEELSDEFAVVAWDAPGCGASSDPPDTFRLAEYADCLAGFIEALDLSCPHLLGHSFGAGLALELYRRHPSIPRSLVLVGAYAGWAGSLPAEEVEGRLRLARETAELLPDRFLPRSTHQILCSAWLSQRLRRPLSRGSPVLDRKGRHLVRRVRRAGLQHP